MTYQENILEQITEAGEILLTSGAESSRIEDTLKRMAAMYDFVRTDVFSITSNLIVTAHTKDGEIYTITRRVNKRQLDMQKIDAVNKLSREICRKPLMLDELVERLDSIRKLEPVSNRMMFFAYLFGATSFAMFFQASPRDCLATAISCVVLYLTKKAGERLQLQSIMNTIIVTAMMCLSAYYMVWLGLATNVDKIIISNIMLLVPGLGIMTSVRDMILGDTISGLLGIAEAILQAFALAMGCFLILLLFGGMI